MWNLELFLSSKAAYYEELIEKEPTTFSQFLEYK